MALVDAGTGYMGDAEVPDIHRAQPGCCPSRRGPGPSLASGSGPSSCTSDSQCTDGVNGRCFPAEGLLSGGGCSYDQCFTDLNCGSRTPCICRESDTDNTPNVCAPQGNCAVDSDCGPGGTCSPSTESCPNYDVGGYASSSPYYCHTATDLCINDEDCASVDAGVVGESGCPATGPFCAVPTGRRSTGRALACIVAFRSSIEARPPADAPG